MCGREGREEERVGFPHFVDVLDAERCMLEEAGSLVVDFEWVRVIEPVQVEQLIRHSVSVIQTDTVP